MNHKQLILSTFLATGYFASNCFASLIVGQTVGIDFGGLEAANGSPGVVVGTASPGTTANNFNIFDLFVENGATGSLTTGSLTDLNGTTISNLGFSVTNNLGKAATLTGVVGGSENVPTPFDDSAIFADSFGAASVGNTARDDFGLLNDDSEIVLTFSGLEDSLSYDFTGGLQQSNNNFLVNFTDVNSGDSVVNSQNEPFVTLNGLMTDGSGNLSISLTRDATQLFIAGATLTAVPEPSLALSVLLLGIASLMIRPKRRSA